MDQLTKDLSRAAAEIVEAGHFGWGNSCLDAAVRIKEQAERIAQLEATASANYGRGHADAHSMLQGQIAELERQLVEAQKDSGPYRPSEEIVREVCEILTIVRDAADYWKDHEGGWSGTKGNCESAINMLRYGHDAAIKEKT